MKILAPVLAGLLSSFPAVAAQPAPTLEQLVAPIALYPDSLVAQILPASGYPTEVVEADRWMLDHSYYRVDEIAGQIDAQPWDPSIKALTQIPSELTEMERSLAWTRDLGVAYQSQPRAVLDAIQDLRRRAMEAGTLRNTTRQIVGVSGDGIVIDSARPDVISLPVFDPWSVYGSPIPVYPGWVADPGADQAVGVDFGAGFDVGSFGGYDWGWHNWRFDWDEHRVINGGRIYGSHDASFEHHPFFREPRSFGDHAEHATRGFHAGFGGGVHGGAHR